MGLFIAAAKSPASPSEGSTRPEPAITGLADRGQHPP
jgi:hypothetical protein